MRPPISSTLKLSILFSFGLVIIALYPANGQKTLSFNLAEPDNTIVSIDPGKYKISVVNMVPEKNYKITITLRNLSIPSISLEPISLDDITVAFIDDDCDNIERLFDNLEKADNEGKVENIVNSLQEYRHCDEQRVQKIIQKTIYENPYTYDLKKGQYIQIQVERDDKKWERQYTTGARGEWRTHFGISAISDWANQRYDYYSYKKDDSYDVGRQRSRNLIMIPSVFFTWMPEEMELKDLSAGLTGGFGTNFDSSSAFAGINITYNQNLTFVLGVATHQQQTISPEYFNIFDDYDLSSLEPISSEDLMIEQIVMNPFISLLIRFSQNPFSNNND